MSTPKKSNFERCLHQKILVSDQFPWERCCLGFRFPQVQGEPARTDPRRPTSSFMSLFFLVLPKGPQAHRLLSGAGLPTGRDRRPPYAPISPVGLVKEKMKNKKEKKHCCLLFSPHYSPTSQQGSQHHPHRIRERGRGTDEETTREPLQG